MQICCKGKISKIMFSKQRNATTHHKDSGLLKAQLTFIFIFSFHENSEALNGQNCDIFKWYFWTSFMDTFPTWHLEFIVICCLLLYQEGFICFLRSNKAICFVVGYRIKYVCQDLIRSNLILWIQPNQVIFQNQKIKSVFPDPTKSNLFLRIKQNQICFSGSNQIKSVSVDLTISNMFLWIQPIQICFCGSNQIKYVSLDSTNSDLFLWI